jgi:hypothetical protein
MTDRDILAMVWGETSNLTPKDGADKTTKRLHAVVAKLVALTKRRGLDGKLRHLAPPRVGTPDAARYETMSKTVDLVEGGTYDGTPLPARAALFEVTLTGAPRVDGQLPKAVSWISDDGVTSGGDFVFSDGADGRLYRLFESDKVPEEAELPFASAVTGSGLPEPTPTNPYKKFAWFLGVASAVVFVVGGMTSVLSGRSMSAARNFLVEANPSVQEALLVKIADICAKDVMALPGGRQSAVCANVLEDNKVPKRDKATKKVVWADPMSAMAVLDQSRACPEDPARDGCNTIWRAAVALDQEETWKASFFGIAQQVAAYIAGVNPVIGSTSIVLPFLLLLAGISGLTIALGLGTKQRVAGVWIDTRNRVSLARAQVTLWTAVALAGYAALALFNIGFAGIISSGEIAKFAAFPTMPASVAAALGIATVSPMISALILPTKDLAGKPTEFAIRGGDTDLRRRGTPFFGAESEGLDKRESPSLASLADIFMGEEKANSDTVDVSRLQNVVITVTLVLGFFSILVEMMNGISASTLLGAKTAIFTSLPEMGATFTSLLFVSHATYLIAKAHDERDLGSSNAGDQK